MNNFFTIKTAAPVIYTERSQNQNPKYDLDIAKKFFNYLKDNTHNPDATINLVDEDGTPKSKHSKPIADDWSTQTAAERAAQLGKKRPAARLLKWSHGGTLASVSKSEDYNMALVAPESIRGVQHEARAGTQQQSYGIRGNGGAYVGRGRENGSSECIVNFNLPLYVFQEVRTAIFNPHVKSPYGSSNEGRLGEHLSKFVQPALAAIAQKSEEAKVLGKDSEEFKNIVKQIQERKAKAKTLKDPNADPSKEKVTISDVIKELQHKAFSELADKLYSTIAFWGSEITVSHGVQRRFMSDIQLPNEVLGKSSMKEIQAAYKTSQPYRAKFHELLKSKPFLSTLLEPDALKEKVQVGVNAQGQPILKSLDFVVKQGYVDWIAANPQARLSYLPDKYLYDTEPVKVNEFTLDEDGNKIQSPDKISAMPVSRWINNTFTAPALKKLNEINSANDLRSWLHKVPGSIQATLVRRIREKMLEVLHPKSETEADQMIQIFHQGRALLFKDPYFVDQLCQQVVSKMSADGMWNITHWGDPGSHNDSGKLVPALFNNPSFLKYYFQKVSFDKIYWPRFNHQSLEKAAPMLKDIVVQQIAKSGIGKFLKKGLKEIPSYLLPPNIIEQIKSKVIELASTDLPSLAAQYSLLPKELKNAELLEAIRVELLKNIYPVSVWENLPVEVTSLPELLERKGEAEIASKSIRDINYSDMVTDSLKELYLKKAIEAVAANAKWIKYIDPIVQKNPEVLKAYATKAAEQIKESWEDVSTIVDKDILAWAEFAPYKETIEGAAIVKDFTSVNYDLLSDNLKKVYVDSLSASLIYHPSHYIHIPKSLAEQAATGNEFASNALNKLYIDIAHGYGREQADNDAHKIIIPSEVENHPLFIQNKKYFYRYLIDNQLIRSLTSSEIPQELRESYSKAVVARLPYQFGLLAKLDDPYPMQNPDFAETAILSYINNVANSGLSLNDFDEKIHQNITPFKAEINKELLLNGQINGVFPEALDGETKEQYRQTVIKYCKSSARFYQNLSQEMRDDPEVFKAAVEGLKNAYKLTDIPLEILEAAQKFNSPEINQEIQALEDKITKPWIEGWPSYEDSYPLKASSWGYLASAPSLCFKKPEFIEEALKRFQDGRMMKYRHNYSAEMSVNELTSTLQSKKVPEDIIQQMTALIPTALDQALSAVASAVAKEQAAYVANYPYEWNYKTDEQKAKMLPYLQKAFIEKIESVKNDCIMLLQRLSQAYMIFGNNPKYESAWKEMQTLCVNYFKETYAKTEPIYQGHVDEKITQYDLATISPEILELTKATVQKYLLKITAYIDVNKLDLAASHCKKGLELFEKDPLLLAKRSEIRSAFEKQIEQAAKDGNAYLKTYICTKCKKYYNTKKILELCSPNYVYKEPVAPQAPVPAPAPTEPPQVAPVPEAVAPAAQTVPAIPGNPVPPAPTATPTDVKPKIKSPLPNLPKGKGGIGHMSNKFNKLFDLPNEGKQ